MDCDGHLGESQRKRTKFISNRVIFTVQEQPTILGLNCAANRIYRPLNMTPYKSSYSLSLYKSAAGMGRIRMAKNHFRTFNATISLHPRHYVLAYEYLSTFNGIFDHTGRKMLNGRFTRIKIWKLHVIIHLTFYEKGTMSIRNIMPNLFRR